MVVPLMIALLRVNVGSDGDVAEVNSKLRVAVTLLLSSVKLAVSVVASKIAVGFEIIISAIP